LNRVRGIESAAHTGLENDEVDLRFAKTLEGKRRGDFKKRRMCVPISDEIANCCQAVGNGFLGNHFAVQANAFTKRDKVRGCEQTRSISLCAQNRIDHGANGPFTIRAGDMDDAARTKIDVQLGDQSPNIFQAELDAEALEAIEPDKCLFVLQRSRHFPRTLSGDHVHGATAK
jgi:hypothetical protein